MLFDRESNIGIPARRYLVSASVDRVAVILV